MRNILFGWVGDPGDPEFRERVRQNFSPEDGYCLVLGRSCGIVGSKGAGTDIHEGERHRAVIIGRVEWNDPATAHEARERGHARAFVEAYRHRGESVLDIMSGDFAVAWVNEAAREAFLAVDRLGIQALTYAIIGNVTVFGSRIDAFRKLRGISADINPQSLFDYLYFDVIPSPNTIFRGQQKLEPAQWVKITDGQVRNGYYWVPDFTKTQAADPSIAAPELYSLLESAVRRCTTDRPIGAFLSGGLDSSTVCGVLSRLSAGRTRSYSIGFNAEGYDEIEYARIAAKRFNLESHEYYITPDDVAAAIPLIADSYEEPFGNSSAIPVYYCARRAREDGVEVMLAGDGGDELFGGNARYAKQKVFDYYNLLPKPLRTRAIEPALERFPRLACVAPLRKAASYVRQAKIPLPDRLQSYHWFYLQPLRDIFHDDFLDSVDPEHPIRLLREPYCRVSSADTLQRMLYLDWKFTLADNDLRKVNQMCAAADVEVRYPMLDQSIVEYSTTIPPNVMLRGLRLRHFFKAALKDFLPAPIINKRKHGFGLPFGIWLRQSAKLQELVRSSLDGLSQRHIVRASFLHKLTDLHQSEHAAFFGSTLWTFTILERWLESHGY